MGSEMCIRDRNLTFEPYTQRSIYPSSLYEKSVKDFVIDYFFPAPRGDDWKKRMYTSHGKAAERVIQDCLFRSGVLECDHSSFQERTVYCPKTGISGRTDGILRFEMLKALGHSKGPQQHEGESELVILEIKETSDFNYSRVTVSYTHLTLPTIYSV